MLDEIKRMFEQQRQQPGAQPTSRDYSGEFQKLSDDIDTLGGKLDRLIQILEPKAPRFEVATLDATGRTFDNLGYKYFGIFAASNLTVTITFQGVAANVNLIPGYNDMTIFQGAIYSVSASTQVGLIWTDVQRG